MGVLHSVMLSNTYLKLQLVDCANSMNKPEVKCVLHMTCSYC